MKENNNIVKSSKEKVQSRKTLTPATRWLTIFRLWTFNGLLAVPLFLFTSSVNAQSTCMSDVKRVYKAWEEKVKTQREQNTIYLNYQTEVVREEGEEIILTSAELIFNKEKSIFLTRDLKLYEDRKYTISVMPNKKVVFINGYAGDESKENKLNNFSVMQDTLFKELEVVSCKEITQGGRTYKKVILNATKTGQELFQVTSIELILDEKLNLVKEIMLNYIKGYKILSMRMKMIEQNFNYSTDKLNKSALSHVMGNSKEKLLSRYAAYRLIDNRK